MLFRSKVLVVNAMGSPYPVIQLGYDGNWLTNGYDGVSTFMNNSGYGSGQFYQGFVGFYGYYAVPVSGVLTIDKCGTGNDSAIWIGSGTFSSYNASLPAVISGSGRVALGGYTQQPSSYYSIRIVPSGGGSMSSGSYSVQWE